MLRHAKLFLFTLAHIHSLSIFIAIDFTIIVKGEEKSVGKEK